MVIPRLTLLLILVTIMLIQQKSGLEVEVVVGVGVEVEQVAGVEEGAEEEQQKEFRTFKQMSMSQFWISVRI